MQGNLTIRDQNYKILWNSHNGKFLLSTFFLQTPCFLTLHVQVMKKWITIKWLHFIKTLLFSWFAKHLWLNLFITAISSGNWQTINVLVPPNATSLYFVATNYHPTDGQITIDNVDLRIGSCRGGDTFFLKFVRVLKLTGNFSKISYLAACHVWQICQS